MVLIAGSILIFVLFGYFPVAELLTSGQTFGKRLVRLRVVGDRGEPITVSQAVIRNLVRIVDILPPMYGIGVVAVFAGGRGKRLGDYAAGTVVDPRAAAGGAERPRAHDPAARGGGGA